jgi:ubiquitin thioesterase protein OTUB1
VLTLGQGPLVGEKRSSHAITEEYAKADPVYVTKTAVSRKARGRDER